MHVWDAAEDDALRETAAALRALGASVTLGGDGLALLDADPAPAAIVKSPGIPARVPLLAAAAARSLPVLDELELAWRLDDRPVVAVTGTNGKSTVAELLRSVLAAAGRRPQIVGNTLTGSPFCELPPDGADTLVAEVSSFQLEGVDAFLPDAAAVTNLTPEHLWHHGTMARYAAAKRRLVLGPGGVVPIAAIGTHEAFGAQLADAAQAGGARVARVGPAGDYTVTGVAIGWSGTRATARTPAGPVEVDVASHGAHMADNALLALALADLLELDRSTSLPALAAAAPVPGRFERVDDDGPVAVVVDFAHNAAGIAAVLRTARALAPAGAVHIACSAPWAYDEAALAAMGTAAGAADSVVVTSDRWRPDEPREAPPAFERGARAAGRAAVTAEPDRAAAIAAAIGAAVPGDVVLILGRGARRVALDDDGNRIPFDDRDVARAILAGRAE